jgi:hypothetical protein
VRAVYRTRIPVDDAAHDLVLTGPILHVATRELTAVEVWHLHDDTVPSSTTRVRVFGTGHPLSSDAGVWVGTAIVPGGAVVWHLFKVSS